MKKIIIYVAALLTLASGTLHAEVIKSYNSTTEEWTYDVSGTGGSVIRDKNTYTHDPGNTELYRNQNKDQSRVYYNFDLTTVTEGVLVGASLTMDLSDFDAGDDSGLSLRAFAYDPSDAKSLYRDIGQGAGTLYSNWQINNGQLTYTFTAAELAEIMESFGGLFSIGLSSKDGTRFTIDNANLTLTVAPEPAEVLLMLAGLGMVLFFHLKRKKSQAQSA